MFIRSGYRAHTRSVLSGTEHHDLAAHVVTAGWDEAVLQRFEPRLGTLQSQLFGGDPVKPDDIVRAARLAVGPDHITPAFEDEAVILDPHGRGLAGIDDAVKLANIRQGRGQAVGWLVELEDG